MCNYIILNYEIYYIFYFIIIYSFIGWCMEVCFAAIKHKRFINRGFLIGPFCPIYGFGATLIIIILEPLKNDPLMLFAHAVVLTSILEYVTGYVLEKSFKHTWWNYTNEPLNLHGRICIKFSVIWGLLAEIIINIVQPSINGFVSLIPQNLGETVLKIMIVYFIFDFSVVSASILHINSRLRKMHLLSNEIKLRLEYVKEVAAEKRVEIDEKVHGLKARYEQLLNKRVFGHSRLIDAFPDLKSKNFDHILKEIKHKLETRKTIKKH